MIKREKRKFPLLKSELEVSYSQYPALVKLYNEIVEREDRIKI